MQEVLNRLKEGKMKESGLLVKQVKFPTHLIPDNYLDVAGSLAAALKSPIYHYNQFHWFLEKIRPNGKQEFNKAVFAGPVSSERPDNVDFIIAVKRDSELRLILNFLGFCSKAVENMIRFVASLDTQNIIIDISTFDNGNPYLAVIPYEVFRRGLDSARNDLGQKIIVFGDRQTA